MRIVGFLKTSLLDWDGKVSAVIYLEGCNFRCPFCHNRDIVLPGRIEEVPFDRIKEYLVENADFLDGVVISGGEPTLNPDLLSLIKEIRSLGLEVKLDTNGTNPDMLDDLLGAGMLDYVAMDVKAPLDERYSHLSGVDGDPELIRRSIGLIMSSGVDYEFRTTVVPVLIKEDDVEEIARAVKGARKYVLQQFRPNVTLDAKLEALDPYPASRIRAMAETVRPYVRKVIIRGDA